MAKDHPNKKTLDKDSSQEPLTELILDVPYPDHLADDQLYPHLRRNLNEENEKEAALLIMEIINRPSGAKKLNHKLNAIGGLIVSTCRLPSFSLRVINQLPKSVADVLRLRILVDFVEALSTKELEEILDMSSSFLFEQPWFMQRCLVRLVLNEKDDLFMALADRLQDTDFVFDFRLGSQSSLEDQSNYTHGPKPSPAIYQRLNGRFLQLVSSRGTPLMKQWLMTQKTSKV